MTTASKCQQISATIDELEAELDNIALTGGVRESTDGNQKTIWNGARESHIKRRISELKTKYAGMNCPAILGQPAEPETCRAPIRPRF